MFAQRPAKDSPAVLKALFDFSSEAPVWQPSGRALQLTNASEDEITRQRLNDDLLEMWRAASCTVLFVTHNVFEAVYLSNRILVMSRQPGRVVAEPRRPLADGPDSPCGAFPVAAVSVRWTVPEAGDGRTTDAISTTL